MWLARRDFAIKFQVQSFEIDTGCQSPLQLLQVMSWVSAGVASHTQFGVQVQQANEGQEMTSNPHLFSLVIIHPKTIQKRPLKCKYQPKFRDS